MIELRKNFFGERAFQFLEYTHCVDDFTFNKFEMNVKVKAFVIHSPMHLTLLFTAIGRPSHKIVGFYMTVLTP